MTPLPPRKGADAFALQAMLLLCLIWGVQQVAVKLAAGDIAPIMQAFARNLLAATLVGLLVLWRGDWKAALTALKKATDLRFGGTINDWFFLAMTHWQLGEKDEARKWYDQAVKRMERNAPRDEELLRLRAEAEQVLGIETKKP